MANYESLLYIDGDANLRRYDTSSQLNPMLKDIIKYAAEYMDPGWLEFRIETSSSATGYTCGSGMEDTRLVGGDGLYKIYHGGGAGDYRAQEFPNGSAETITTYYLKARNKT